MTEKQIDLLARRIAQRLFTNGSGRKAQRLVLTVDRPIYADVGGWNERAVVEQIKQELLSARLTETSEDKT